MKTMHKTGISALRTTVENGSKRFEENIQQVQSEMKNVSESSVNLKMELKKVKNYLKIWMTN